MKVIKPLKNITRRAIENRFYVSYYYTMSPIEASYFILGLDSFVSHDDMVSARIIIS